jgi:hypothetical protein
MLSKLTLGYAEIGKEYQKNRDLGQSIEKNEKFSAPKNSKENNSNI